MAISANTSTRERLLDIALELFARKGFSGTSIRAIAREAGMRESSIYNHFASKEDLYAHVIGQWGPAEFVERLKSAEYRALSDDPVVFLETCVRHLVDRWMNPKEHLFLSMIMKEAPDSPGQMNFARALFHDEIELLADYFRHFSKSHNMVAPDPVETARMFTGGLVQIRRLKFANPEKMPVRADVEKMMQRYVGNFIATVFPDNR